MNSTLLPLRFTGWATRTMLEACRPLSADELARRFDVGCGSVPQTFLHMVSSDMYWTDRLLARPERELPEDVRREATVDEMLGLHAAASGELYDVARRLVDEGTLEAPVKLLAAEYGGRIVRVATVLAHTVNHAAHHRAHARIMLRLLGHPVSGDLDPVEWELAGER